MNKNEIIYFDSAATTKPCQEVLDVFNKVSMEYYYNGSSMHIGGLKCNELIEKSKKLICNTLELKNKEIYFTASASEANNMAIYGICNKYLGQNKRIITTKIEHPSVFNPFIDLESKGFDVAYLDVNSDGIIDLNQLKEYLTKDTILVSIMWVNNIVGSIMPIKEIIEIVRNNSRAKLLVDAVQGLSKIDADFKLNDVDMFTYTPHKFYGLKGSGVLVTNDNIELISLVKGAKQQKSKRAGTLDVAGIVAGSKALKLAMESNSAHFKHVLMLNEHLSSGLSKNDNLVLIKPKKELYCPYILCVSNKIMNAETLLHGLEKYNIVVSVSSACSGKLKKPEKTVLEMTKNTKLSENIIRISFSMYNTIEEIDMLIDALNNIIKE